MRSFAAELDHLERKGLLRRRRTLEGPQGAHVEVDGNAYASYCSNDYLGLANHPRLVEAACEGARRYGVGAGASHLLCGHGIAHARAEKALAEFLGLPAALLFSTGYMANIGAITMLAGRNDALFCDKLNHASLNDAAVLSRAKVYRYPHLDMAALAERLARAGARRKLVVTDAVFSMDGDIAPVPELLELCERFDAWLLLDDAHGFGVLGSHGGGILSHFEISSPRIVYVGTLGKAAGVAGAFVAGRADMIEMLVQRAGSYIYTTAQPPLLSEAILASLDLIAGESWRRAHLHELILRLKSHAGHVLQPSDTPIQPLVVGENEACLRLSSSLQALGILVPAIRPPTVPKARLRISLSAAHTFDDLDRLIVALKHDAAY
ncbi:MAG: 8-amino-7-oxononanoate synthase [Burkholderiales bacterium]|nr:8-amino-7-oxononanoate synthase [Burkholderiales bacterium]